MTSQESYSCSFCSDKLALAQQKHFKTGIVGVDRTLLELFLDLKGWH